MKLHEGSVILLRKCLAFERRRRAPLKWARRTTGEVGLPSDKTVSMMNDSQVSWECIENRTGQVF